MAAGSCTARRSSRRGPVPARRRGADRTRPVQAARLSRMEGGLIFSPGMAQPAVRWMKLCILRAFLGEEPGRFHRAGDLGPQQICPGRGDAGIGRPAGGPGDAGVPRSAPRPGRWERARQRSRSGPMHGEPGILVSNGRGGLTGWAYCCRSVLQKGRSGPGSGSAEPSPGRRARWSPGYGRAMAGRVSCVRAGQSTTTPPEVVPRTRSVAMRARLTAPARDRGSASTRRCRGPVRVARRCGGWPGSGRPGRERPAGPGHRPTPARSRGC